MAAGRSEECLSTGVCAAESTAVGSAEVCSLITGNFPITSPKDIPLLGCKKAFNVSTHHKVYLIKRRPCTLAWLRVRLAEC